MDESSVRVIPRNFESEGDKAFIYSSWRNSSYYGVPRGTKEDAAEFFREKTKEIDNIFLKCTLVRIACLQNDPYTIIGYSVSTGDHLNWIYVKADFRNKGIGRMLLPANIKTVPDCQTTIGSVIAKKLGFEGEK